MRREWGNSDHQSDVTLDTAATSLNETMRQLVQGPFYGYNEAGQPVGIKDLHCCSQLHLRHFGQNLSPTSLAWIQFVDCFGNHSLS